MKRTYAVIGSGALGGYYGGKLAQSGREVHFLLHSDFPWAKKHGLTIESIHGNFTVPPDHLYPETRLMPACDVVLVCLKTHRNALLATLLPPLLHPNTQVILIQNGLGMEQDLEKQMPGLAISGGIAYICSSKTGPGKISHYDQGNLTLGTYRNADPVLLEKICRDFKSAGVPCKISPDIHQSRWEKLVWNIPYNGLTVLLNTTTDQLMKNPSTRQLIRSLMIETTEAAAFCGAAIPESFVDNMLHYTDKMVPYTPSMKVDFDHGRTMEIEAIYSNPILAAHKAGYTMSKAEVIEQQLRFIQIPNE